MIGVKITALLIVLTVIAKFFIESLLANESIGRKWDMALGNNYPKYVLSLDEFDMSRNGIIHMNIIDFLKDETI